MFTPETLNQLAGPDAKVVPTRDWPLVSLIIPCRNEESFISTCLDSLLAGEYPKNRLEILVVDGLSSDHTRAIVEGYARAYPFVQLLCNPMRTIPSAMNLGIERAKGDVLIKIDAHSSYPPGFVPSCVNALRDYAADNVGGVLEIKAANDGLVARTIAAVLRHPFGSGNALVKVGAAKPTESDAVAFGCFPRTLFARIGMWNERLVGSSDMDINQRILQSGGKIFLLPTICVRYYADAELQSFWAHNFADGVWATYVMQFGSRAWAWRHWVPFLFVLSLTISIGTALLVPAGRMLFFGVAVPYLIVCFGASASLAKRERDSRMLLSAPLAFGIRHIAHGMGASYGLLLSLIPGLKWRGRRSAP